MRTFEGAPVLEVRSLSKTFPGQRALDNVDLTVRPGEIHALLGQNGSGKSTVIKILAGYHPPDPGAVITVDGQELRTGVPGEGHSLGLRFVHQDLGLVAGLSVIDNLALGRRYRTGKFGRIQWRAEAARADVALRDLGLDIDPYMPVDSLSVAERAILAIARAVHDDVSATRVLILDEPTAALPADEVEHLFAVMRRLRDRGVGIVLVSHHLEEVLAVADRVTVLRDGKRVDTVDRDSLDHDRLVHLIVGRSVVATQPRTHTPAVVEPCLTVDGLSGGSVRQISLVVGRGEVVGVSGLDGSGREAIIPLLSGQRPRQSGVVSVGTTRIPSLSPLAALRAGMAFVPSERGRAGLFATMSLRENLTIAKLSNLRRYGRVASAAERAEAQRWIDRLSVVTTGTEVPIATLSGGNQQKVMLGRSLRLDPAVLLLDEPTQGVDIGARSEVHSIIEEAVERGMGVLVASTDSDELVRLCHRVLVLQEGRSVRELHRGHDLNVDELNHAQLSRVPEEVA